jgi:hypothetical protein
MADTLKVTPDDLIKQICSTCSTKMHKKCVNAANKGDYDFDCDKCNNILCMKCSSKYVKNVDLHY